MSYASDELTRLLTDLIRDLSNGDKVIQVSTGVSGAQRIGIVSK